MSQAFNKINSVSFWRIVFLVLIVLLHCGVINNGYLGVEFFFVIAGVLLAYSNEKHKERTVLDYMFSRIKRLYPQFFLASIIWVALLSIVFIILGNSSGNNNIDYVFSEEIISWKNTLMLQIFGQDLGKFNGGYWFVPALFWASLLCFLIIKKTPRKIGNILFFILASLFLGYYFFTVGNLDLWEIKKGITIKGVFIPLVSDGLFRAIGELSLGILIFRLREWCANKQLHFGKIALIVIEVVSFSIAVAIAIFMDHTRFDYIALACIVVGCFCACDLHEGKFWNNRFVENISRHSYSLYLNQFVFLLVFAYFIDLRTSPLIKSILVLICDYIYTVGFDYILEKINKRISNVSRKKVLLCFIVSLICVMWLYCLIDTSASYYIHSLVAIISFIAFCNTKEINIPRKNLIQIIAISVCLALVQLVGQYDLVGKSNNKVTIIIGLMVGGFIVFFCLFRYAYCNLKGYSFNRIIIERKARILWPVIVFILYVFINIVLLILVKYPLDYQYDTIWQLSEVQSGEYTNHHSIYHTWVLKGFWKLGDFLGIGLSGGMFMYTILQVIICGLVVSYFIKTLCDMKTPFWLRLVSAGFFILNPLNIKYSTYLVKDGLFTFTAFMFIVALYRIMKEYKEHKVLDWICLFAGGLLFGVLRGNGFLVLLVTMVAALLVKSAVRKKLIISFSILAVAVFFLNGPIHNLFGVEETEFTEKLSIPIQQISRVIADDKELSDSQSEYINKLLTVEEIKEYYQPDISDPIKGRIQFPYKYKDEYVRDHKFEYLKLYLELGLKYPIEYIKGFTDQTKGYWVIGYGTSPLDYDVHEMRFGYWDDIQDQLIQEVKSTSLQKVSNDYTKLFATDGILFPLLDIFGKVLLILMLMVVKLWKKENSIFIEVSAILLIISLMMASPLVASLRYSYLVFLVVFLSIGSTFTKGEEQ